MTEHSKRTNLLDRLSPDMHFPILAFGAFLFYRLDSFLMDELLRMTGFKIISMLGYWEAIGITVFSYVERTFISGETGRVAPLLAYPLLAGCHLATYQLSKLALNYINFPTKVVFQSFRLLPTMVVASIMHQHVFTMVQYISAICICIGLVSFAAADWNSAPNLHPIGIAVELLSFWAVAIVPNAQERLFRLGASRLEVIYFTNVFRLTGMTLTTVLSGDLFGLIDFATTSRIVHVYMIIYALSSYIAVSIYMTIIRRFGGVAAVLVGIGHRVISFIIHPEMFVSFHIVAAQFVLVGVLLPTFFKTQEKKLLESMEPLLANHDLSLELPTSTTLELKITERLTATHPQPRAEA